AINENVRWRAPLPEPGNSTPIIWDQRVFITQAVGTHRKLICFDRLPGSITWENGAVSTEPELTHETNPFGSSSPVTDGARVVAWFGSAGLYCFALRRHAAWHWGLGRH